MSERRLFERLDDLAQLIEPPMVPIGDDLARGRRRLRRRRQVAAGITLAGVAAAGVIASVVHLGTTTTPDADVAGPASGPSSAGGTVAEPSAGGGSLWQGRLSNRRIVAAHLDPAGEHLSDRTVGDLGGTSDWALDSSGPASSTESLVWRADGPGTSANGTVRLTLERGRTTLCAAASDGGADQRTTTCRDGELAGVAVTEIREPQSSVPRLAHHRRDGLIVSVELDIGAAEVPLGSVPTPPPGSVLDGLPADGSITEQQVADLLSDPALAIPTS